MLLAILAAEEDLSLGAILLTIIPLAFILVFFVVSMRNYKSSYGKYLERAMEHMDALEKKMDRTIELLEQLNKK